MNETVEDDLTDLMQVFDIFDVFDSEDAESVSGNTPRYGPSKSDDNIFISKLEDSISPPLQLNGTEMESESASFKLKVKKERKKRIDPLLPPYELSPSASAAAATSSSAITPTKDSAGKTSSKFLGSDEDKERLRRENNKQSARNSRKKKKEYVQVLTDSIAQLTAEVGQLRAEYRRKSNEDSHKEKLAHFGKNAFLQALDLYGPESQQRKVSSVYQFENLTRNVAPPHTRFLLWAVARRATEVESAASKTWKEVSGVLALKPEQDERLAVLLRSKKATDLAAAEERDKLQYVFNTILKLRSGLDRASSKTRQNHAAVLDILTPQQQATLLSFVEETRSETDASDHLVRSFALRPEAPIDPRLKQLLSHQPPNPNRNIQSDEAKLIEFLLSYT